MREVSQCGVSVREKNHSGVSVGTMSHNHERSESEWSKCEKKGKESVRIVTPKLLLPNSVASKYFHTVLNLDLSIRTSSSSTL